MKYFKSMFLILVLNTMKISWGKSILQPPISVLRETLDSIPIPVANNGIRFFSQGFPQYQTLTQTKAHQLPVWHSPQGIFSYLQGQNNQLINTASGSTHSVTGLTTPGSSQVDVSSHPILQSQSLNQGIFGDNIYFPGSGQLLESIKLGNANGITGYVQSGGTNRPQSILSTDGTLIQSPIRPDVSIQNTLFSGGGLQVQGVPTSFPNQVQYPTIGNSEIFGGLAPQAVKWGNINVPNVRPLGSGIIYTSGSTSEGTETSADSVASILQNPGVQTQFIQVPCTLQIPSPVPISVNPGISQISTNNPMNQQSSIPSSFIDNSPPSIAILRPPSSVDTLHNFNYASVPVAAPTTYLLKSTNGPYTINAKPPPSFVTTTITEETKENSRSPQDSPGVLVQNDDPSESELKFASGFARNSLPIQYSTRPMYSTGASAMTADNTSTKKQVQSPTSRPTRGKNPFFSVNKRKHFEFYSYF